jgi:peptidoglycan/xylan/chitin deacetylase (PgdA/CDA1 family)
MRAASAAVVRACLGTAFGLAVRWWPEPISSRHRTPATEMDPQQTAALAAFGASVPADRPVVLSYHDIAPADDPRNGERSVYTVTPEAFDSQMAMLAAAGFTSITQDQMTGYINGDPVPPRAVLITFDDGTKGIWRYADRILERYGFHATSFIITGSVGTRQPYYLTWNEMRAMRDNGRWDFAAHTHDGHAAVPVDASGTTGPFLLNRQWLADQQRQETLDEWRNRVTTDLDRCVEVLVDEGFDRPQLFAHPFAAVSRGANDPAIPIELDRIVEARFVASVANNPAAGMVGPSQVAERHVLRIAVRSGTTTDALFERLQAAFGA